MSSSNELKSVAMPIKMPLFEWKFIVFCLLCLLKVLLRPFLLRNSNSRAPKIQSILFFFRINWRVFLKLKVSLCQGWVQIWSIRYGPYHIDYGTFFQQQDFSQDPCSISYRWSLMQIKHWLTEKSLAYCYKQLMLACWASDFDF